MGILEEQLRGESLADYTNEQLRISLNTALYTNTADMWKRYLEQQGYSGSVADMMAKWWAANNVPPQFRNYINSGLYLFNPRQLFQDGSIGVLYDNNDFVDSATWRRNMLTYSEQFDNAAWAKTQSTVIANSVSAPDGTLTADEFKDVVAGTYAEIKQLSSLFVSGTSYTYTVRAKQGTRRYIYLSIGTRFAAYTDAIFDLQTGVVKSSGAGVTSATITAVGGGFYACTITATATSSGAGEIYCYHVNDAGTSIFYTGTGSGVIYLWGAQLERGSVATDYQRITDFNSDFLAAYPSTTLYEDAAGTIPARVNGLVGLQLDKSQGLVLGAELVTNGGFDADTNWTKSAGVTISGGKASFVSVASGQGLTQTVSASADRWYSITATVSNRSIGAVLVRLTSGTFTTLAAGNGTFTAMVLAGGSQLQIYSSTAGGTFDIDDISVKELPGNHRYQATTGSKPILRGTPTGSNLVTNGDFASGTGWSIIDTAPGSTTISGGTATMTNGSTGTARLRQALTVGAGYYRITFTVSGFSGATTTASLAIGNSTSGDLTYGGVSINANGTYTRYVGPVTGPTLGLAFVVVAGASTSITIDNVEVVDVSAGSVTAPYGLQYDGVDDFLLTASVNFSATDKMFVCAGVRKLSDALDQATIVELGTNSAVAAGFALQGSPALTARYRAQLYGTSRAVRDTIPSWPSPDLAVISILFDIAGATVAEEIIGRRNGSVAFDEITLSPAGTGNFPSAALYFGRRGGTTLPYNGLDFGFVIVGKTLTAAQISSTERWMAQRTGVSI